MDELISAFIALFAFWGAWMGILVAAIVTWSVSSMLWGEFKIEVFVAIAIPSLIGGVYVQHLVEKESA